MAAPSRTSISALPRGHEFAPQSFTLSTTDARAYLNATGDTGQYGDTAPPLAAVAMGLAALQEQLSLPHGALHTGQEIEHSALVPLDAPLSLRGRVAQRSERQGYVISVLEFEVESDGSTCIRARTTIMAPGDAS
ncbi:MAG TPA: hypothetical protein VIH21_10495 [Dehalococcoidia bacterium]|jgi:hypothetical protein